MALRWGFPGVPSRSSIPPPSTMSPRRMRICLVSKEVAPFWGAGIGVYVAEMARAYVAAGHDVHVITAPHAGVGDGRREPALGGVTLHAADPNALGNDPEARAIAISRYGFQAHALACHRVLKRLHAQDPFDYIEFPEYWADGYYALTDRHTTGAFEDAVMGVRLHTPTELARELNGEHAIDVPTALLERMELECVRMADVVVSPCRSLLDHVRGMLETVDEAMPPGHVVPYPFDIEGTRERLSGSAGPLPEGEGPLVLYFGRLERRKGVDLLATAAINLMDRGVNMRLMMVGGDTRSGRFGRWMGEDLRARFGDRMGRRVRIEGPRNRDELGGLIRAADVVCLPSRWENFPNALLESMALGSCCIVGNAGGMAEIVHDGVSGATFEAGDAAALERRLESVLTDGLRRAAFGLAAPKRLAELCEPAMIVRRMEGLIESVASAAPRVPGPSPARPGPAPDGAPHVSVIVPFYNLADTLPETLDSLRAQTFQEFEVIVVDDGSTHADSREMIDRLEREFADEAGHPRWRVLRKPNGGLGSARNAGIAAAQADLILPLDADDILEPTYLATLVRAMALDPSLAAVSTFSRYFETTPDHVVGCWLPVGFDRDLLCCENWAANATALMRKSAILECGGYDEWLTAYEDWDLYCGMARRGHRCMIVPEFLFCYRLRPGSMLRTEGFSRRMALRAHMLARHRGLALRPERALRIEITKSEGYQLEQRVREVLYENIRYRLADKVNDRLKGLKLQHGVKSLARRAMTPRRAANSTDAR